MGRKRTKLVYSLVSVTIWRDCDGLILNTTTPQLKKEGDFKFLLSPGEKIFKKNDMHTSQVKKVIKCGLPLLVVYLLSFVFLNKAKT